MWILLEIAQQLARQESTVPKLTRLQDLVKHEKNIEEYVQAMCTALNYTTTSF